MTTTAGPDSNMLPMADRKLELLMEIDDFRDSAEDPEELLSSVVDVMAKAFEVEACLLFVNGHHSGEPELKALWDRSGRLGEISPGAMAELARETLRTKAIEIRGGPEIQQLLSWPHENLQLAVVPIVMGGDDRVGTLLLARTDNPFDESELDLLTFAESQLDSALVQARNLYELDLRNRELETIYRVDRIRDTQLAFDEMLDRVLGELRRTIRSDVAFILLYDRAGKQLELRATSPNDLGTDPDTIRAIETTAGEAVEAAELVVRGSRNGPFGSIMCVPLILREEILGVFGMASKASRAFREGEQRLLRAIASQMDTAIFETLEQGRLRQVLGRTVDPRVLDRLLENPVAGILEGERHVLTVLYADLRGSTHLAENTDPKDLVAFINDYLGEMAEIVVKHEGTLDKFMGDEVMAFFGAPLPMEDHALRAVHVGLEMQEVHQGIMERWTERGLNAPPLGVGIASGEMIVGEMGSGRHSDYTVLGRPANLGARICSAAKPGQVLVSPNTFAMVEGQVEANPITGLSFKGISADLTIHEVLRIL